MERNKIEFALIIAEYVAEKNMKEQYGYFVDNAEWRDLILKSAENTDLLYTKNDLVDSEWAYETAYKIADKLLKEYKEED